MGLPKPLLNLQFFFITVYFFARKSQKRFDQVDACLFYEIERESVYVIGRVFDYGHTSVQNSCEEVLRQAWISSFDFIKGRSQRLGGCNAARLLQLHGRFLEWRNK